MRVAVVVAGVASLLFALTIVIRRRDTVAPVPMATADLAFGARVVVIVGRTAGMVAAGMAAGVMVLGLGGRLMMRLLAVTSPDAAQGRITEADEVVGEVTFGGTMFLVVIVGIGAGLAGLIAFGLLRRWLPRRSLLAGLVAAGVGAGLLARPSGFIDPDNRDFALLSPTWLAVLLCVGLVVLFGLLLSVLVDRWGPRWPRPGRSITGVASVLPIAALALAPPVLVVVLLAMILTALVVPLASRSIAPRPPAAAGRAVVAGLGVLGGAWTLVAAGQILTA
ncbi:MAG: hypothetical protein JWM05_3564 [Acidimicrobiales bacterium]|nr:hypothetical protein [Acidimicrobiales bacterium]